MAGLLSIEEHEKFFSLNRVSTNYWQSCAKIKIYMNFTKVFFLENNHQDFQRTIEIDHSFFSMYMIGIKSNFDYSDQFQGFINAVEFRV
jgi:hypothetical protein